MPSDVLSMWKAKFAQGLRALEDRDQLRELLEIHGVNLCSNDYLGLARNADLRSAVVEGVRNATRLGSTGSRLLSGHTEEWRKLEDAFANFAGTEAALFFGSGYAANVGLLSSIIGKDDVVFSDALNHASLIDGIRLSGARKIIYPHLDLNALESALRAQDPSSGRKLIVTESVFSMDGDVAPLADLVSLAGKYGAALIVDEAHATAVHGPEGRGLVAETKIQTLATIHTCGKALASAGAFVCGSAELKQHLVNNARTFIFSTALPPYMAHQIGAALGLAKKMDKDRATLLQNARQLCVSLKSEGFDVSASASQIVPIVLGSNEAALAAAEHLQRDGFAVRAIRPPTVPHGASRLRLSLTTLISPSELSRLLQSLIAWRASQQTTAMAEHA